MNYYQTNFKLIKFHEFSIADIEEMYPWERDVYVAIVIQHVEEENEKIRQQKFKK